MNGAKNHETTALQKALITKQLMSGCFVINGSAMSGVKKLLSVKFREFGVWKTILLLNIASLTPFVFNCHVILLL